ncbi:hypothetical protein F4823DRAFT_620853 [Ustulina deusta]|nr:hypothetical protein F4823DRAFT_620853 [Ustulina deusta]
MLHKSTTMIMLPPITVTLASSHPYPPSLTITIIDLPVPLNLHAPVIAPATITPHIPVNLTRHSLNSTILISLPLISFRLSLLEEPVQSDDSYPLVLSRLTRHGLCDCHRVEWFLAIKHRLMAG